MNQSVLSDDDDIEETRASHAARMHNREASPSLASFSTNHNPIHQPQGKVNPDKVPNLGSSSSDDRVKAIYQEYCKMAEVANTLRAAESFWMDRWHELALRVVGFMDTITNPYAQVAGLAQLSDIPLVDTTDYPENSPVPHGNIELSIALGATEEHMKKPPSNAKTGDSPSGDLKDDNLPTNDSVPIQLQSLAESLATRTREVHSLANQITTLKSRHISAPSCPSADIEFQNHATNLTEALVDVMHIESQRKRLAEAVTRSAQRRAVKRWQEEAQRVRKDAINYATEVDEQAMKTAWHEISVQIHAIARAVGARVDLPSPSDSKKAHGNVINSPDHSNNMANLPSNPSALVKALTEITVRAHQLETVARSAREHNARLLREIDQKDVAMRLLESQVNWLKVNHETVAHQQSAALALQAHTIHSLAAGSLSSAGDPSFSHSAGFDPRLNAMGSTYSSTIRRPHGTTDRRKTNGHRHETQSYSHSLRDPSTLTQESSAWNSHSTESMVTDDHDFTETTSRPASTPPRLSVVGQLASESNITEVDPRIRLPRSSSRTNLHRRHDATEDVIAPSSSRYKSTSSTNIHKYPHPSQPMTKQWANGRSKYDAKVEEETDDTFDTVSTASSATTTMTTYYQDRQRMNKGGNSGGMDSRYDVIRANVPQRADPPSSLRTAPTTNNKSTPVSSLPLEEQSSSLPRKFTQSLARKVGLSKPSLNR